MAISSGNDLPQNCPSDVLRHVFLQWVLHRSGQTLARLDELGSSVWPRGKIPSQQERMGDTIQRVWWIPKNVRVVWQADESDLGAPGQRHLCSGERRFLLVVQKVERAWCPRLPPLEGHWSHRQKRLPSLHSWRSRKRKIQFTWGYQRRDDLHSERAPQPWGQKLRANCRR